MFGLIANIALVANVAMIVALLSLLGATLTLPGIAGIVLTIGMAVDSNVLIYERIREERRNGRSVVQAHRRRLPSALATIIDANLTTLIAAVIAVLARLRPGARLRRDARHRHPHDGLHRLHADALADRRTGCAARRPEGTAAGRPVRHRSDGHRRFHFMAHRAATLSRFSASLLDRCRSSLFLTVGHELRHRLQGRLADRGAGQDRARPTSPTSATRLADLNLGEVQVQEFGEPGDVLIRVGSQDGGDNAEQTVVDQGARRTRRATTSSAASRSSARRSRANWPGTARSASSSLLGVMLIYIWFRFEWQFAVGAILATLHDIVLTVGFFVDHAASSST